MRNFLKLCLLGTVVAGGVVVCSDVEAAKNSGFSFGYGNTRVSAGKNGLQVGAGGQQVRLGGGKANVKLNTGSGKVITKVNTGGTGTGSTVSAPKTYSINEVNSSGPTSTVANSSTGLRTVTTQNGTFMETSSGSFTKVNGSTTVAGNSFGNSGSGYDSWTTTTFENGNSISVGKGADGAYAVQNYSPSGEYTSAITGDANGFYYDGANGVSGYIKGGEEFPSSLEGNVPSTTLENGNTLYDVGGYNVEVENGKIVNVEAGTNTQTAVDAHPSEELAAEQKPEAEAKAGEAEAKAAEAEAPANTGNETNAIQYAIVILQAVEGMNQEDATRKVTVEGAQKLQESQGSSSGSTIPSSDTSLDGSNLSCAANSLAYLLQENPVDLSLMDVSEFDPATTAGQIAIKNRRNQLLQEYAVSAAIISAGSNAISSQFYRRVSQLAATASGTTGTLGSMSVLNDSERYPYFEMVRQVALSGVQLGLKGASNLTHIIVGSALAEKEGE